MRITFKNLVKGLIDQGPPIRFVRNLLKGHLVGWVSDRSHFTYGGQPKIKYNSKASAQRAAEAMGKKVNVHFSNYKCLYCDGYHIGKNSLNKISSQPPSN
jgi:hypothetical protein